MKTWPWVPAWVAVKSNICARYDCNELRHETTTGVRRYCEAHCRQYDKEARAIPTKQKFMWACEPQQRAGVPGTTKKRRGTGDPL